MPDKGTPGTFHGKLQPSPGKCLSGSASRDTDKTSHLVLPVGRALAGTWGHSEDSCAHLRDEVGLQNQKFQIPKLGTHRTQSLPHHLISIQVRLTACVKWQTGSLPHGSVGFLNQNPVQRTEETGEGKVSCSRGRRQKCPEN